MRRHPAVASSSGSHWEIQVRWLLSRSRGRQLKLDVEDRLPSFEYLLGEGFGFGPGLRDDFAQCPPDVLARGQTVDLGQALVNPRIAKIAVKNAEAYVSRAVDLLDFVQLCLDLMLALDKPGFPAFEASERRTQAAPAASCSP